MKKYNDVNDLQHLEDSPSISEGAKVLQSPADSVPKGESLNKKSEKTNKDFASGEQNNKKVLEREIMIRENMPLVYFFAKRMARSPYCNHQDFEDLVSVGTIGLIKAVDGRDLGRSDGEWKVYMATSIRSHMGRHLHKSRHKEDEVEHVELEGLCKCSKDKSLELLDFYEMINLLKDSRQRELLIDKYVAGRNCADMGRERGLSRERVRQIIINGEETLKKILTKLDSWR